MKVGARVKSLASQRMQGRGLSRQRAKKLLVADAVAGQSDEKAGRSVSEAEFCRRFRQ